MEFAKILKNCKPTQGFTPMDVSEAQLESILEAGSAVPMPEDYWDHFHISFLPQQLREHHPPVIIIAARYNAIPRDRLFFYAGLLTGGMILQTTNLLLGFRHYGLKDLEESGRELPAIPAGYEIVQLMAVGYPIEEEEKREEFYGVHSATIAKGLG